MSVVPDPETPFYWAISRNFRCFEAVPSIGSNVKGCRCAPGRILAVNAQGQGSKGRGRRPRVVIPDFCIRVGKGLNFHSGL